MTVPEYGWGLQCSNCEKLEKQVTDLKALVKQLEHDRDEDVEDRNEVEAGLEVQIKSLQACLADLRNAVWDAVFVPTGRCTPAMEKLRLLLGVRRSS